MLLFLLACRVEFGAPSGASPAAEPAGGTAAPAEVWVYTSMYQEVIDKLQPRLQAALPGVTVQWFQAGSEKVAQRWEAEEEAGGSKACLLATSDPGWYVALTERQALAPYISPRALELDRAWVAPTYAAFRMGWMVLGAKDGEGPTSFAALTTPPWKDRFSTGDPLSSGTMFSTYAAWSLHGGAPFLQGLRQNGWVAAGGNSAVMTRMETGEKPVGVVLLENLLAREGAPPLWDPLGGAPRPAAAGKVLPIVPEEGAVPIPGMLALTADCPAPAAARSVYDWLMTPEAQAEIVGGHMHSPFPGAAPPAGALPLEQLRRYPVPADFTAQLARRSDAFKQEFQALFR